MYGVAEERKEGSNLITEVKEQVPKECWDQTSNSAQISLLKPRPEFQCSSIKKLQAPKTQHTSLPSLLMHGFLISVKDRIIHSQISLLSFTPFFALQSQFVTEPHTSCFLNTLPAGPSSPCSGINSVPISSHPVRTRVPLFWLRSLFSSSLLPTLERNCLSCKQRLSPDYNLSVSLAARIWGSDSTLLTTKPCVVPQPHLPQGFGTCLNSSHQDPHHMGICRLKCRPSSSLCP